MSGHSIRRVAVAGVTALALVAMGAGTAFAASTNNSKFAGTLYLQNASSLTDIAPGTTIDWLTTTVGVPTPSDDTTPFPAAPAGTTSLWAFITTPGTEDQPANWKAFANIGDSSYVILPPLTPYSMTNGVLGAAGIKAAGGVYSMGFAYASAGGAVVQSAGLYFVQITMATDGSGSYTYETVSQAKTASQTQLLPSATSATEGAPLTLTATVTPSGVTGDVQFKDNGTNIGSPVSLNASGVATTTISSLVAGSHTYTAVYSGNATYDSSTGTADVAVAGAPQTTTVDVATTPISGTANDAIDYTATVVAANLTAPTGTVAFTASQDNFVTVTSVGTSPVTALDNGIVTINKSNLGEGTWAIRATFVGTGLYQNSVTGSVAHPDASLTLAPSTIAPDNQTVTVNIPHGALTITTPYNGNNALALGDAQFDPATSTWNASAPFGGIDPVTSIDHGDIVIVDNRPGNYGWTGKVVSSDFVLDGVTAPATNQQFSAVHAGLIGLAVDTAKTTSAQLASGVHVENNPANTVGGLSSQKVFATLGTGAAGSAPALGSTFLTGTFELKNVETSVLEGLYKATVTFTVQ